MAKTSTFRWLVTILAFLVVAELWESVGFAGSARLPNVVFILVDDMGYGDAGCYNDDSKIPTPNIDSLASAGMRFTDAHASGPLCHLSRYGLMTGEYPFRANIRVWPRNAVIKSDQPTIATLMRSSGYRTAMVGKWHLGFEETGYENPLPGGPVDVGFDSYFGIRASTDIPPYFYIRNRQAVSPPTDSIEANNSEGWTNIQGAFWRAGGIAPDLKLADVLPRFTQEAIDVIDGHAKSQADGPKPLMLYLAYPAPHTPWLPADEYIGKSEASMYGDFTLMVDDMIGKVLKSLDEAGMTENTMVIFSSDNGPVWYDEDVERFGHDSSGGLRGMKADAWEGGHRMPFIVRWPGRVKPGSVSSQTISFCDMFATFAELTGTQKYANGGPDSFSFLGELTGQKSEQPIRKSLLLKSGGGMMTVRRGPWKLIEGLGSGGFSKPSRIKPKKGQPAGQLYNLNDDLSEQHDLFAKRPDIVAGLRELRREIE